MQKEELWIIIKDRNPQFENGPIEFQPATLRKFFDLVWDQAMKSKPHEKYDLPDFFGGLFGGKKM